MCGICAVVTRSADLSTESRLEAVRRINADQRHRGPDASYTWHDRAVTLGQCRLAIVDLTEGGRQPFFSSDGRVAVIFNGEIYNHRALRTRYGLDLCGPCDGAILPELWQRLGTKMFAHLRGMWAITVWDEAYAELTVARDGFGIKPLYWMRATSGDVVVASELRPLLRHVKRVQLKRSALADYLRFGAMPNDDSGISGVNTVPPNSWQVIGNGAVQRSGPVHVERFATQEGRGAVRDAFVESVDRHLQADVPVALLLSSGLDSASIAWALRELGKSVTCVTVGRGEAGSESLGAARTAAAFGHDHRIVDELPEQEIGQTFAAAMQRPSIDGLNTFLVSRAIAKLGFKVALSGLGGDEMLAGYRTFRLLRWLGPLTLADRLRLTAVAARLARVDGIHRRLGAKAAIVLDPRGPRDADGLCALSRTVLQDGDIQQLLPSHQSVTERRPVGGDRSARALSLAELHRYLERTLLPDTDAFSMACSVEMRVPYVDVPFARAALNARPTRGIGKRGFAAALGDPLLRSIARAPKRGFTLPMEAWMRSDTLGGEVRALRSDGSPVRCILESGGVDLLLDSWDRGAVTWSRCWLLAILDGWLRSLPSTVTLGD